MDPCRFSDLGTPVSLGSGTPGSLRLRWLIEWLPELIFVTASSVGGIWAGGRWLDPIGDPGFSWSLAYRLVEGDLLYRDVYLAYGPLSPYFLAGIGRLFQFSAVWIMLSNWIAAILAGILLLRCGRPFLTTLERIATAGLILAFSLWVPGSGRLVLPYCPEVVHALILSLVALLVIRSSKFTDGTRSWFAGILAGLAFCAKQEIGLAVLIALLTSLLVRARTSLPRGVRIVTGFAAVVALCAIFVVWSASLDTLRERNHLWPFDLIPPAAWSRLLRIATGMSPVDWTHNLRHAFWGLMVQLAFLACFGLLASRVRKLSHWTPVLVVGVVLFCWWIVEDFSLATPAPVALSSSVAFLIAALAIASPNREKIDRSHLVAIGMFAALASVRAIFSPSISAHFDGPAHFPTSLTWVLFLCVFAPRIMAFEPKASLQTRRLTAILLLIGAWYGALRGAESLQFPVKEAVETPRGTVFLDHWNARLYRLLSRELKPGERALVLPEINSVDVIFRVRSVSPLLFHLPGWLDLSLESELIRQFEAKPPDVVILFNRPLQEFGVARFGEGYGELLSDWVSRNYQPVARLPSGALMRRQARVRRHFSDPPAELPFDAQALLRSRRPLGDSDGSESSRSARGGGIRNPRVEGPISSFHEQVQDPAMALVGGCVP
jgi:hypothetical protein